MNSMLATCAASSKCEGKRVRWFEGLEASNGQLAQAAPSEPTCQLLAQVHVADVRPFEQHERKVALPLLLMFLPPPPPPHPPARSFVSLELWPHQWQQTSKRESERASATALGCTQTKSIFPPSRLFGAEAMVWASYRVAGQPVGPENGRLASCACSLELPGTKMVVIASFRCQFVCARVPRGRHWRFWEAAGRLAMQLACAPNTLAPASCCRCNWATGQPGRKAKLNERRSCWRKLPPALRLRAKRQY